MNFHDSLRAWILADATLSAMVGDRVFWLSGPQQPTRDAVFPATIYIEQYDIEEEMDLAGGLMTTRSYTLQSHATMRLPGAGLTMAQDISDAIRSALHGHSWGSPMATGGPVVMGFEVITQRQSADLTNSLAIVHLDVDFMIQGV